MGNLKYAEKHIQYLREISNGNYNDDITKMFNKKFNMNVTESAIATLRYKNKIKNNMGTGGRKEYTKEMEDFIKKIAPDKPNKEVTEMFNKKFNQNRTIRAIKCQKNKLGITTTYRKVWEEGHTPWNKGTKGYMGPNITSFKKGDFSPNRVPLGSERITKDDYVQIKVRDGKLQQNWRGKHILIWEKINGPLPKGHAIIFGDGDNRNFDIGNLICVSRKQLLGLNRHDLIQQDAELTRTAVNIVDMNYKISELSKEV